MKCKKHPKYQVKRKPRSDCQKCWELWNLSQAYPEKGKK